MSIFSTLDFVTIESSSFHNSIPNLMYVSRRFCIHVIISWRPKNCTGALKNWNLGEKNLYTAYLWSQNHTIYLPLNQVWCMSRKESLSYYIDQTMLVLLIDWYTNQLIGEINTSFFPKEDIPLIYLTYVPTYWCTFCLWPNLLECCIPDILAAFCQFLKVKLHWYGYTDKWSQNYNFYNIYYTIYLSIWVCTHSLV